MRAPEAFTLEPKDFVPNNPRFPVLVYRGAVTAEHDPAAAFERRFADNGWPPQWRDSVFPYHHYHSRAHEALGIAKGRARLVIGGPGGRELEVEAGDALVLPAGTGHKRIEASEDFLVVGAYPPDQADYDICRDAADDARLERITTLPAPESDPVMGRDGCLRRLWLPDVPL
jgi:uncharacterized protein YjlB